MSLRREYFERLFSSLKLVKGRLKFAFEATCVAFRFFSD